MLKGSRVWPGEDLDWKMSEVRCLISWVVNGGGLLNEGMVEVSGRLLG